MFEHNDLVAAFKHIQLDTQDGLLYTINRDLCYKGNEGKHVIIPCNTIHAQLKLAENTARQAILRREPEYNGNLATANIGFVVSSHPYDKAGKTHNRRFITIPLHRAVDWQNPNKRHWLTAQIRDLWGNEEEVVATETGAGKTVNKHRNFYQLTRQKKANSYATSAGLKRKPKYNEYDFEAYFVSSGPNLEMDFHHSEQTIFEMLQKADVINYYINHFLTAYNVLPGDKIYAVILDLYTTRYMCQGCYGRAYSTAHYPGRALLARWDYILRKRGYYVPKTGLRMAIRATGEVPGQEPALSLQSYKPQQNVWTLNPGRETINSIVMEADAKHIPAQYAPYVPFDDLFRRTVFLSDQKQVAGYVQDAAITQSFRFFLSRFQGNGHNVANPMAHQKQGAAMPVSALLAALTPKLNVPLPATERQKEQLARCIYLLGQPEALTDAEFRGLYFI